MHSIRTTKNSNLDIIPDNDPPKPNDTLNNKYEIDDDDDGEYSIDTDDSLQDFIDFCSHRNSTGLEESISFTYPQPSFSSSSPSSPSSSSPPSTKTTPPTTVSTTNNDDINTKIRQPSRKLTLSTLLEEDDLAPLFDGAGWAGTRVWSAAIWGIQYIMDHYYDNDDDNRKMMNLCELGCGLGVPGLIWHQFGGDVVLCDQESIMSQLTTNVRSNFPDTCRISSPDHRNEDDEDEDGGGGGTTDGNNAPPKKNDTTSTTINTQLLPPTPPPNNSASSTIQAHPLTWSRPSLHTLLTNTGYAKTGFDIVLNCDCVYEPLYGRSWEALVEVIDECLKVNPRCLVITSVERRDGDGIDEFVERMEEGESVGCVEKVKAHDGKSLELYVTRGVY